MLMCPSDRRSSQACLLMLLSAHDQHCAVLAMHFSEGAGWCVDRMLCERVAEVEDRPWAPPDAAQDSPGLHKGRLPLRATVHLAATACGARWGPTCTHTAVLYSPSLPQSFTCLEATLRVGFLRALVSTGCARMHCKEGRENVLHVTRMSACGWMHRSGETSEERARPNIRAVCACHHLYRQTSSLQLLDHTRSASSVQ